MNPVSASAVSLRRSSKTRQPSLMGWRALLLGGLFWSPWAWPQAAVFRCGQELTNLPAPGQVCERMTLPNYTQIEGPPLLKKPSEQARPNAALPAPLSEEQKQRRLQARAILEDEWLKAKEKHAKLVQDFNQGQHTPLDGEAKNHAKYLARVNELQSNMQRSERDMLALQRELSRYSDAPVAVK